MFDDTSLDSALAALSADLAVLSGDLRDSVYHFTPAMLTAVGSYSGLSIRMVADGIPVTVTALDNGVHAGTSRRRWGCR